MHIEPPFSTALLLPLGTQVPPGSVSLHEEVYRVAQLDVDPSAAPCSITHVAAQVLHLSASKACQCQLDAGCR